MSTCSGCDSVHDSYRCPYRGMLGEQRPVYPSSLPPGFDEWLDIWDTEETP